MHESTERIIKNIAWNFLGQGGLLIISFLATPFIVHRLNVNLYGLYTLLCLTIGYFAFLQLGLGTASIKYISQYLAVDEKEKIRKVFWVSLFAYLFLGAAGMGVISIFSPLFVERFFNISRDLQGQAIFLLRIGSFALLTAMFTNLFNGVTRALQRFGAINRIELLNYALQMGSAVILLKAGFSLTAIIISNILIQSVIIYIYWIFIKRSLPCLVRPSWDFSTLRDLFRFGKFVIISNITEPILRDMEKIFLTRISLSSLTYYYIPYSLIMRLSIIPSAFASVIFPASSHFQTRSRDDINRELHSRSVLYIFFIHIFFVMFFIFSGEDFLTAWMGRDFARNSSSILIILPIAGLINSLSYPSVVVLQGMGRPYLPAFFYLIEVIFYIPLAYILIYKLGGTGAGLAWLLRVSLDTFILHKAACGLFREHLFPWYGRMLARAAVPFTAIILLFWVLKNLNLYILSPLNLGGLLLIFIIYAGVVYRWGLDDIARHRLRGFLKR